VQQGQKRVNSYCPFQKTLFLDFDTEVNGDLTPMFDCLHRFDIIAKLNSEPTSKNFSVSPKIPAYAFPTWNTGVIFLMLEYPQIISSQNGVEYFRKCGLVEINLLSRVQYMKILTYNCFLLTACGTQTDQIAACL
jgi:hypothetical protein